MSKGGGAIWSRSQGKSWHSGEPYHGVGALVLYARGVDVLVHCPFFFSLTSSTVCCLTRDSEVLLLPRSFSATFHSSLLWSYSSRCIPHGTAPLTPYREGGPFGVLGSSLKWSRMICSPGRPVCRVHPTTSAALERWMKSLEWCLRIRHRDGFKRGSIQHVPRALAECIPDARHCAAYMWGSAFQLSRLGFGVFVW